jgi:hypothetical protein
MVKARNEALPLPKLGVDALRELLTGMDRG